MGKQKMSWRMGIAKRGFWRESMVASEEKVAKHYAIQTLRKQNEPRQINIRGYRACGSVHQKYSFDADAVSQLIIRKYLSGQLDTDWQHHWLAWKEGLRRRLLVWWLSN